MSTDHRVEQDPVEIIDHAARRRGAGLIVIAVVLGLLTGGVGLAVNQADNASEAAKAAREKAATIAVESGKRDVRIENLETALDAQRAQFNACKDKKVGSPGCVTAVTPPSGSVGPPGPSGLNGSQGIQGIQGLIGPQGPQGVPGADGKQGPKGDTGSGGTAGTDGSSGAPGEPGPAGPQGEPGPPGQTGPEGPAGYPESFSYNILTQQYTCTDTDGDHTYTCEPDPTP